MSPIGDKDCLDRSCANVSGMLSAGLREPRAARGYRHEPPAKPRCARSTAAL